ncbi:hypothetical protein ACET3Z_011475 [Daucus carota]
MGRRGKVRSSSTGTRGKRSSIALGEKVEDRISQLSNDLINHILCYVDSKVAVQTMVLSKRWLNLWPTLPCLNFEPLISGDHEIFVTFFLKNRDQQYLFSKVTMDCLGSRKMLNICLDYALPRNSIEHLCIRNGDLNDYPCLNSAYLKTLHLTNCRHVRPMSYWTLPSLTSLYLKNVRIGKIISGFENLKELTLAENSGLISDDKIITINCPKLQKLTLCLENIYSFIVSAPSLLHLSYRSQYVPAGFSARDGFPLMKRVHIDIQRKKGDFSETGERNRIKFGAQRFISMLNAVRETVLLELSSETIEGLRRIPDLHEYEPPAFCNLEFISLRGLGLFDMRQPCSTDHVIEHLFANSPYAKIIITR